MKHLYDIKDLRSPDNLFEEISSLKEFIKHYNPEQALWKELNTRIGHLEEILLQALIYCNDTNEEWLEEQGFI